MSNSGSDTSRLSEIKQHLVHSVRGWEHSCVDVERLRQSLGFSDLSAYIITLLTRSPDWAYCLVLYNSGIRKSFLPDCDGKMSRFEIAQTGQFNIWTTSDES